jgi:hypothetical protein
LASRFFPGSLMTGIFPSPGGDLVPFSLWTFFIQCPEY